MLVIKCSKCPSSILSIWAYALGFPDVQGDAQGFTSHTCLLAHLQTFYQGNKYC